MPTIFLQKGLTKTDFCGNITVNNTMKGEYCFMSKVLTSIGVKFYIGYSNSYNKIPTSSEFRKIPNIIEASDFDLEPEAVSTNSYDNLDYRTYIDDTIDTGGVQSFTVNSTVGEDAESIWNEMAELCENGKYIWLRIVIPQIDNNTYIPICPIKTRGQNIKLNDRLTRKLYYTIIGDFSFSDALNIGWNNLSWYHLPFFNEGKQLTSSNEIDVKDINMLFNNLFYLKGE